MAEQLKGIVEIMLDTIYAAKNEKLANNEEIINVINKLRTNTKLSLKFNISHNLKDHEMMYPLVSCDNEHCFECLAELVEQGFDQCEHYMKFSPYELAHIKWITSKFREE